VALTNHDLGFTQPITFGAGLRPVARSTPGAWCVEAYHWKLFDAPVEPARPAHFRSSMRWRRFWPHQPRQPQNGSNTGRNYGLLWS
jgi:hypothetical protein